jgi:hypothetical protein
MYYFIFLENSGMRIIDAGETGFHKDYNKPEKKWDVIFQS